MLWTERMPAFEILPKLRKDVKSQGLARVVAEHREETTEHAKRLEAVFRAAGAEPSSHRSDPVEKLAAHHDELAGSIPNERLADVFHATAAATTEHLEIAHYDALLELARIVEVGDAAKLLEQNRKEEAQALEKVESHLRRLVEELGTGARER
jgi:ferritin-like metal-binding protein YciE